MTTRRSHPMHYLVRFQVDRRQWREYRVFADREAAQVAVAAFAHVGVRADVQLVDRPEDGAIAA
jgi:hypothetical protein